MFFKFWSQVSEPISSQPAESLRDKMIRETESALTVKLATDRRFARNARSSRTQRTPPTDGNSGAISA